MRSRKIDEVKVILTSPGFARDVRFLAIFATVRLTPQ